MHLRILLLCLLPAAGAAACSGGANGSSGSGGFGGGSGFSTSTGSTAASTSGQVTSATSATAVGSTGTGATGSGGGAVAPPSCSEMSDCGNLGDGCIKCAAKSSCAVEYDTCFGDDLCKAYWTCIEPCGSKALDCLQSCENQYPAGAAEYHALTQCVICGDCAALCVHAPDTCK